MAMIGSDFENWGDNPEITEDQIRESALLAKRIGANMAQTVDDIYKEVLHGKV